MGGGGSGVGGGGGVGWGGGSDAPPQLPIPKILFHPLAEVILRLLYRAVIGENMPHYDLLTIHGDWS